MMLTMITVTAIVIDNNIYVDTAGGALSHLPCLQIISGDGYAEN